MLARKKQNIDPMWKVLIKQVHFPDHDYMGYTQRQCETSKDIVDDHRVMFESRIFAGGTEKASSSEKLSISSGSYDMEGHAKKYVERYCELANKTSQQLYKVSTPCLDDHQFKEEGSESVGEVVKCMLSNCSETLILRTHWWSWYSMDSQQIYTCDHKMGKCLCQTSSTFDLLHSFHEWIPTTLSCGKYSPKIQNMTVSRLWQCRRSLIFEIDFRSNIVRVRKSHVCSNKPMCKKQTCVSHSSTDSEIIFLDTNLRMDGITVLDPWDLYIAVMHSNSNLKQKDKQARRNLLHDKASEKRVNFRLTKYREMFEVRISATATTWKNHTKKCVERFCELANKTTQQLYKVSTPCIDDHHFKEEEMKSVGELSKVCSQIVLKCLYLARIGRLDILWSVNKLARSIAKWTKVCDKRLSRLISYIHHTCDYKQNYPVGKTAEQCRVGLLQDSDFTGDLEDSRSTSDGTLCVFGSHTFVPISWMCKKQICVSHRLTDFEIISVDVGLRLDGTPALDLWDLIIVVIHGNTHQSNQVRGDPCTNLVRAASHKLPIRKKFHGVTDSVDFIYIFKRAFFSSGSFVVYLWRQRSSDQDDHKGKKSYHETCFQNPQTYSEWVIQNKFGPQKPNQIRWHHNQLADISTKGNFTRAAQEERTLHSSLSSSDRVRTGSILFLWYRIPRPAGDRLREAWRSIVQSSAGGVPAGQARLFFTVR